MIRQAAPVMLGAAAVMGGELDRLWFDVLIGDNPDRAKAEYQRYQLHRSAAKKSGGA